jgi:WD40 repeat protein
VEKPIRPPIAGLKKASGPDVARLFEEDSPPALRGGEIRRVVDNVQREQLKSPVRAPSEPNLEISAEPDRGFFSVSLRGTAPRSVAFDDRGFSIFVAFATGDVFCIDLETRHTRWWRRLTGRPVNGCAEAGWLALGYADGNVQLITQAMGTLGTTFKTENSAGIRAIVMVPGLQTIATPELGRRIALWSLASGERMQFSEEHSGEILSVAYDRTRGYWLSGSRISGIRVWSKSLQLLHVLRGAGLGVRSLAVAPNGNYFAAGYTDGKIGLFDARRWEIARMLEGHTERVHSLAFLRDSNTLISGAADGNLLTWNLSTGRFNRVLPFEQGHVELAVQCVAISPNDDYIASASAGKVRVYRWPIDTRLLE